VEHRLRPPYRWREERRRQLTGVPLAPWLAGIDPPSPRVPLSPAFFLRPVAEVARDLLGCVLVSTVGEIRTSGVIVETEAYGGAEDPASHAATRGGVTPRNRAMFGPAGRAYVYRSYGMHWCMNVVAGPAGTAAAVLLRGLDPLEGREGMLKRREGRRPLCSGPGRLTQAMEITDALYGHDLSLPPLAIRSGWAVDDALIGISGRVGVSVAGTWPYRFFVRGSPGVSPARGAAASRPARDQTRTRRERS